MRDEAILRSLCECAGLIEEALTALEEWSSPGKRPTQHACDVVADEVASRFLIGAGFGVISEERRPARTDRSVVVVVDPIDGTRNAIRGITPYGPSLCAFVDGVPRVAHVRELSTGESFDAIRGAGASVNGVMAHASAQTSLDGSLIAVSGGPVPRLLGARVRMDAAAFALCAVGSGRADGFLDLDDDHHRCWDYAGGMLICQEAGAAVCDAQHRPLWPPDACTGRTPLAAATPELLDELVALRSEAATRR